MGRIVVFGNGNASISSIEYILSSKHDVLVVVDPKDDGVDTWQASLLNFCKKNNILFIQPPSFKDDRFLEELTNFNPHIILSIQCRWLIKENIRKIVKGEIFNFHFADLPRNRGCYPGVWHILNGDKYAGVTLHVLTEGIDDGAILDKERKEIELADTGRTIYDWCCDATLSLLKRNLQKLLEKRYQAQKQDDSKATYYSRYSLQFDNLYVDWSQTGERVGRFIQAFSFPPLQFPKTRFVKGEVELKRVIDIRKNQREVVCGAVLGVEESVVSVQVADAIITVEVAEHKRIEVGSLFYL